MSTYQFPGGDLVVLQSPITPFRRNKYQFPGGDLVEFYFGCELDELSMYQFPRGDLVVCKRYMENVTFSINSPEGIW